MRLKRICTVVLASLLIANQPGIGLDKQAADDRNNDEYDIETRKVDELLKAHRYEDAVKSLKRTTAILHDPEYGEALRIFQAVTKQPLNPDGHIAIGIYYMHWMDSRFNTHNVIDERQWTPQADYEFQYAIELSPNHQNAEASAQLVLLKQLKEKALRIPSRWHGLKNFYEELLVKKWNMPPHNGCLICRADINRDTGKAFIVVPSASKEFDDSVIQVLDQCRAEFPSLDWCPHSANFAFMSTHSAKLVCTSSMSIWKKQMFTEPQVPNDKKFRDGQWIRDVLATSLLSWQIVNIATHAGDEWEPRQLEMKDRKEKIFFDEQRQIIGYSCALKNGGTLRIELKDSTIANILLNEKPDILWLNAYQNRGENAKSTQNFFY